MPRKQRSVEEIIGKLREAEVALAQGGDIRSGLPAHRCIGPHVLSLAAGVRRT